VTLLALAVPRDARRRWLWLAAGAAAVFAAWGVFVAFQPHRESRRLQQARFSFVKLGMPRAAVLRGAGTPDQTCNGGESVRLLKGQLARDTTAGLGEEELLQRLERGTAEVLVYHFPEPSAERGRLSCGPAYLDTAIGLDATGNVLWLTILRGEDLARHAR
jgi:hypothetical protein